ncbi:MAG: YggU family protein [Candidatus Methanoperedenaceae archaeon]|nr:YggU family protein [Candidatus Methanoperedenaceae archaeon]MDW7726353.1 DUF167 domain-containing protein [Candidatus Methanoperedens sp.]
MKDALIQVQDGVILELEITPNAKETGIQGYNPWRKRIEVRLSERAHKGKANEQLVSFFSDLLNAGPGKIELIAGHTSSKKSIKVTGVKSEDILGILSIK